MDDLVAGAASKAKFRRAAIATTSALIRRRLDPRLIAADVAKLVVVRSIQRATGLLTKSGQRKRALVTGVTAAAAAIGLRVLYRNEKEKNAARLSREIHGDDKPSV